MYHRTAYALGTIDERAANAFGDVNNRPLDNQHTHLAKYSAMTHVR